MKLQEHFETEVFMLDNDPYVRGLKREHAKWVAMTIISFIVLFFSLYMLA